MTNHTQGRWKNNKGTIFADNKHETLICEVFDGNESAASNARLIAAAPELLAALKAMLKTCYDLERNDATIAAVKKARAAIAAARSHET